MKQGFKEFTEKYKANPAWYWLLFTVFSFFLLPEYVSPFILFAAYIIFKRQWTKEGRLARLGNIGKIELCFLTYMLISALWSKTKLDTLGSAGLWWAVILIQVMIYNLARTRERIEKIISALVASAAINGAVGAVQFVTFVLYANGYYPLRLVLTTPFYRNLDTAVYTAMPFKISTFMWTNRASGFFSNPNLLATFMIVAFPLGVYLLFNAKSKKEKVLRFAALVCISFGMASTQTRAGCYLMIALWVGLFILFLKRHALTMLALAVPTVGSSVFSILSRYGRINIYPNVTFLPVSPEEALLSSARHFEIWRSMLDFLTHHAFPLIFGMGFGCESSGRVLLTYGLNKPHSHNFVIEIWAELGIVGLIFLFVIICYAAGKLLEIDITKNNTLEITAILMFSFISYFAFGLSDYIFNSPKQIIFMMILIGLIQAASYTFEKHEIHTRKDLIRIARNDMNALIRQ